MVDDQHSEVVGLRESANRREEGLRLRSVHAGRGLVDKKETRTRGKSAGQLQASLLSVRKGSRPSGGMLEETLLCEQLPCGCNAPACRELSKADLNVLLHRQLAKKPNVLKGPRNACRTHPVGWPTRDILAIQIDPSRG